MFVIQLVAYMVGGKIFKSVDIFLPGVVGGRDLFKTIVNCLNSVFKVQFERVVHTT